jgi:hypothetical protein
MVATTGSPTHALPQAIAHQPTMMGPNVSTAPMAAQALIAPAVSPPGGQVMMHQGLVQPIPAQDTLADGRKKRELSNSKRAAQNRAAQVSGLRAGMVWVGG